MSTGRDTDKQTVKEGGDTCTMDLPTVQTPPSGGDSNLFNILLARIEVLGKEFNAVRNDINNISSENKALSKVVANSSSEIKASINHMKENFKKFNQELNKLTQDNRILKKEIELLRSQIASNNQSIYRNTIKISNVPAGQNENLIDLLKKICSLIQFEFNPSDIDAIYRKKSRYTRFEPIIVVSFLKNGDKSKFLKLRKLKGEISTTDIDPSFKKSIVYFSEYMSPWNLRLYSEARQLRQKGLIQHLWFRNGRILVRINTTSPVTVINSVEDLKQFQPAVFKGALSQGVENLIHTEDDYEDGQAVTSPAPPKTQKKKRKALQQSPSTSSLHDFFFRPRSGSTST
uniref:FP protein C-terminal domain-containing protein n=1 Tax=Rhodnius prolixus TaxID=13249 RepID=T1HVX3_RHOPR